jgi:NADH:ubiquinone oxidoreductase subunit 2 (subunit N)
VERGNIVTWREDLAAGFAGKPLAFGATLDDRSILLSTVVLFGAAIAIAAVILVAAVLEVRRRGRAQRKREGEGLAEPRV